MAKRQLKDVDAAARAHRLQIGLWAFAVGFTAGTPIGGLLAYLAGVNVFLGAALGFAIGFSSIYFLATFAANRAGAVAGSIYHPSGSSTPPRREYSQAESLVVRGRYEEAVTAYERHCVEYPDDPEPYLRLARIHVHHLHRYEKGAEWFRRARQEAHCNEGQELQATLQLVDLYLGKLEAPRKAIPELVHISRKFAGTPSGEAAERELAEMREILASEQEGVATFTETYLARQRRLSGGDPPTDMQSQSPGPDP